MKIPKLIKLSYGWKIFFFIIDYRKNSKLTLVIEKKICEELLAFMSKTMRVDYYDNNDIYAS